ncbi:MAG TPA: purine-nucleoside phosphorylase [Elusimicrobiota bacterium]|nr:purine-nucleoside phosphorylase [Elusimicrobiota bacterium]
MLPSAVEFLRSKTQGASAPGIAIVLGSGLGPVADTFTDPVVIPYTDIPGFVGSTVAGHAGKLIFGRLSGKRIVAMKGRLHFYEGHSMEQLTFPYRVFKRLGIETLVLTSAVGGISPRLKAGDLMAVRDHINFMGENPLRGPHYDDYGARFPDMSEAYPKSLRDIAKKAAKSLKFELKEGIYCAVRGPSYETPMEIQLFKKWGADVVGMSVIPETLISHQEGVKVLAITCVSNKAAGLSGRPLSHEEVMETGRRVEKRFSGLIAKIVEML